jgi:hypothetical protein
MVRAKWSGAPVTGLEHREIVCHLSDLKSVWDAGMCDAYGFFKPLASPEVALAAALVESAVELHQLGREAPDPRRLLLGDLCVARAARMLAISRDQRRQVAFARVIEIVAASAAAGRGTRPVRELLTAAIADAL